MEYHESAYGNLITQSIQKVYEKGISNRILEHMRRIRNSSDINQARRWPMELLQNAQDLAWDDRPVRIRITETEDSLIYEHTGKPFRVKDILAIINQVSSKTPGESVGQFGTGFMTTYQMSEQVELESMLKEDGMPYQRFHITLDRSGHTQEELHEVLEKNMNELMVLDTADTISEEDYDKDSYHTSFTYRLADDYSREVAETGIRDLKNTILFVLLFASGIGSIELNMKGENRVVYERGETRPISQEQDVTLEPGTEIYETVIHESGKKHYLRYASIENAGNTGNGLTIALEYDPEKGYLKVGENTARVFVDFPLIGAEDFPFPMVVNCRALRPNEPRSNITLVDLERSEDAATNKVLMEAAVLLYGRFLQQICNENPDKAIAGIENVICMPEYHDRPDWSESWVYEHIYDAVYEKIRSKEIIQTSEGLRSLDSKGLRLIESDSADEREQIIKLCDSIDGITVPIGGTDWYASLSSYRQVHDENKHTSLEFILMSAKAFVALKNVRHNRIEWCQQLFDICMGYERTANLICTGRVAVFPNQDFENGIAILRRITEIYQDPDIPEVIKDVAYDLDMLNPGSTTAAVEPLRIRECLLHKDFHVGNLEQMRTYPVSELINYIVTRSKRSYPVSQFEEYSLNYLTSWQNAWFKMLSCCPDKEMYDLCSRICKKNVYPVFDYDYEPLDDDRFTMDFWRPSMRELIKMSFNTLGELKDINALSEKGLDTEWLNSLFHKAPEYMGVSEITSRWEAFPDQYGNFRSAVSLREDRIEEKGLKNIACSLAIQEKACDVRAELLDKRINLDQRWNIGTMDDQEVSGRISRCIQRILSSGNLNNAPDNVQDACTSLLAWLQEHHEKASILFPDFSTEEQQAKLMTATGVVNLQKRSRTLDKLMAMTGADNTEDLMDCIQDYMQNGSRRYNTTDGDYDFDTGVFFGPELQHLSDRDREVFLRRVGDAGEKYAFDHERQNYIDDGWELISEDDHRYSFSKNGKKAEICRPDTGNYHQQGWDIRIREWDSEDDTQSPDREQLIEVKTHTTGSVMHGIIPLSRSQMRLALSRGNDYTVYVVDYDTYQGKAVGLSEYADISSQIADGTICFTEDRYLLKIAG